MIKLNRNDYVQCDLPHDEVDVQKFGACDLMVL